MNIKTPIYNLINVGLLAILLSFATSLQSQSVVKCDTEIKMEEIFKKNPSLRQEIEEGIQSNKTRPKPQKRMSVTTIPVHVIVVHTPGLAEGIGNNIDYDRVISQIDVLNEDFRRDNDDADDTPSDFEAVDSEIEFCLATVDPGGFETDGITRYPYSGNFEANESTVKSATTWNRLDYLNIWVVPNIGPLGWAYLPSTGSLPSADVDGVVVLTSAFGGPGEATFAPYNLGRTATHEVGHYLGLRHVWGNGGCSNDDGFSDTPMQSGSNFGCPSHPSPSCGNSGDMFMNYMDYVNDACMFAFTQEQADHMNLILSTSRSALSFSENTACGSGASPISIDYVDIEDVTCPGGSDGVVEVEAIDGSAPFTFTLVETGESNSNGYFDNLEEGDYTFTVEDSSGSTAEIELEVNGPNPFFTNVTIVNEVSCIGSSDGEVIIDVAGGNGFYDFDVPGLGLTSDDFIEDLAAGEYIVTIIDGEDCEVLVDFELEEPDSIHLLVDTLISISCFGGADGSIEVDSDGGTGDTYTYQVLGDGTNLEDTLFTILALDTFTFVAEDINGCTDTSLIVMTQPDSLQLMLDTLISPTCFGDSSAVLILDPIGGNSTFTYLYDTFSIANDTLLGLHADTFLITAIDENNCMDTTSFIIENPILEEIVIDELVNVECGGISLGSVALNHTSTHLPLTYTLETETNQSGFFTDLAEGDFTATAIDTLGCESILEFSITTSGGAELSISNIENIECAGDNDGSFTIEASGGTGFTYSLDGVNFQESNTFSSLSPSEYTAYVLDSDDCITEAMVMITAPDPLTVSLLGKTDNLCFGEANGTANLLVEGGTGETQILVNGEEAMITLTDLTSQVYTVEVIDENECSTSLEFTIEQPTQIEVTSFSSTQSTCSEDTGSLSIEATGGTGDLTYELDGVVESIGEFSNLSSQIYTVIIQDQEGCSIQQVIDVEQAADIQLIINAINNESCVGENDGSFDVEYSGGTGNVTYYLDGNMVTIADLDNLVPADYVLSIEDEEGCSDSEMLTVRKALPLSLSLLSSNNITCNGGSDGNIRVEANGGTGEYTYSTESLSNTSGFFENLANVSYLIIVEDSNGCEAELPVTLEMPEAIQFLESESFSPSCAGGDDGQVELNATGGSGLYTYTIDGVMDVDQTIENLSSGTYSVLIEDTNGCIGTGEIEILEVEAIDLMIVQQTPVSCKGGSDATVIISASSGDGNYTYTLDGQSNTTGQFDNLTSGNYSALVTDGNDCSQQVEVTIDDGEELEFTFETLPTRCANDASGTAIVTAVNGNPPYDYILDNQTNSDGVFEDLLAADYTIIIRDANGCEAEVNLTIVDTESIIVDNINTLSTICFETPTGAFSLDVSGGTGDYTIEVDGQVIEGTEASSLSSGAYSVIISDDNGCSITQAVLITEAELLEIDLIGEVTPRCAGENSGQVTVAANGGTGSYTYTYGNETNTTGTFNNLEASNFIIQVMDDNGCDAEIEISLDDPSPLVIDIDVVGVSCADGSDGVATVFSQGGTGEIEYSLENGIPQFDQNFSGLTPNEYTVIVVDSNGCEATDMFVIENTTAIDTQSVTITPIDINQGIAGELIIEAMGGSGPYTYSLNGIDYQTINLFENLEAGPQTIYIQDNEDCIRTFDVFVDSTALCGGALSTVNQILEVSVNPNPVTNTLNLTFCNSGGQKVLFTIFDDRGRYIYDLSKTFAAGNQQQMIDVSEFPVGIYIIGITSESRTNHYRFAKID